MSEQFDLAESIKKLGQLVPVLKDKFGNVIDGFHRLQIDPNAKSLSLDWIDTPEKLETARLAANYPRRTVNQDELKQRIGFLARQGIKAKQVSVETGIPESTVFKYYPSEQKDQVKAEAGQKGGVVAGVKKDAISVEQTVKTSDIKECERCHVVGETKVWNGHYLCLGHYASALENPAQMKRYFQLRDDETKKHTAETKPIMPRDLDSWKNREAQMHPQHSRQEQEFVKLCQDDDDLRPVIMDRPFYAVRSVPDAFLPRHNAVVYVDGLPHEGHEEEDEKLRQAIAEANNVKVFVFKIGDGQPADWRKQLKEKL